MKLATLNDGTRDGRLIVVSRDLRSAAPVPHARNLQNALDNWDECLAEMLALSARLNDGHVRGTLEFDPRECLSPLPRAYQWAYASQAASRPGLTQASSDAFFAPTQEIALASEGWHCDLRAGLAVMTRDIAAGVDAPRATSSILLLMLFHDMQLAPVDAQAADQASWSGAGAAFSPVAATPDELGEAWDGQRLHATLRAFVNGVKLGELDCAAANASGFADLISQAARTRRMGSGSIFGLYPSSTRETQTAPLSVAQGGAGFASIAELRADELRRGAATQSLFLGQGDQVQIDLLDRERLSVFGAITQRIALRDA
ncbi:MAG: fumarylacetoacetate hydrolase family protein [Panacagrimonas sp.]